MALGGPVIEQETLERWDRLVDQGDYATVLDEFQLPPVSGLGATPPEEVAAMQSAPGYDLGWADLVALAPTVAPAVRSVNELNHAARYKVIETPTLLLLGSENIEHPFRDTTRALNQMMPNASMQMLEGQRHLAIFFAPHLVAENIRSFAAESGRGEAR